MTFMARSRNSRVALVVDTPNIAKSLINRDGPRVRPDYTSLIRFAKSLGNVSAAVALVNDGVNSAFSNALSRMGFQVKLSHAFDCDDAVVAWAVRLTTAGFVSLNWDREILMHWCCTAYPVMSIRFSCIALMKLDRS